MPSPAGRIRFVTATAASACLLAFADAQSINNDTVVLGAAGSPTSQLVNNGTLLISAAAHSGLPAPLDTYNGVVQYGLLSNHGTVTVESGASAAFTGFYLGSGAFNNLGVTYASSSWRLDGGAVFTNDGIFLGRGSQALLVDTGATYVNHGVTAARINVQTGGTFQNDGSYSAVDSSTGQTIYASLAVLGTYEERATGDLFVKDFTVADLTATQPPNRAIRYHVAPGGRFLITHLELGGTNLIQAGGANTLAYAQDATLQGGAISAANGATAAVVNLIMSGGGLEAQSGGTVGATNLTMTGGSIRVDPFGIARIGSATLSGSAMLDLRGGAIVLGSLTASPSNLSWSGGLLAVENQDLHLPSLALPGNTGVIDSNMGLAASTPGRNITIDHQTLSVLRGGLLTSGGDLSLAPTAGSHADLIVAGTRAVANTLPFQPFIPDTGLNATVFANSVVAAAGNLYVGGGSAGAGGTALLWIQDGGAVQAMDTLTVFGGGSVVLDGGILRTNNLDLRDGASFDWRSGLLEVVAGSHSLALSSSTAAAPYILANGQTLDLHNPVRILDHTGALAALEVRSGATLKGKLDVAALSYFYDHGSSIRIRQDVADALALAAQLQGELGGGFRAQMTNSGALSPGQSPGELAFVGDFTQNADGNLLIELAGYTAGQTFDHLTIMGSAALAGTLSVSLLDGFAPSLGDTFEFLNADRVAGTFALDPSLAPPGSGMHWEVLYGAHSVSLQVAAGSAIPEPSTYAAIAGAFALGLAVWLRRPARTARPLVHQPPPAAAAAPPPAG